MRACGCGGMSSTVVELYSGRRFAFRHMCCAAVPSTPDALVWLSGPHGDPAMGMVVRRGRKPKRARAEDEWRQAQACNTPQALLSQGERPASTPLRHPQEWLGRGGAGACLQKGNGYGCGALTRMSKIVPSICTESSQRSSGIQEKGVESTHAPATVSQAVQPPSGGVRSGGCGSASSGFSTRSLRLLSDSVVPVPWEFAIARRVVCGQGSEGERSNKRRREKRREAGARRGQRTGEKERKAAVGDGGGRKEGGAKEEEWV